MHVNRPIENIKIPVRDFIQELLARSDAARRLGQRHQEIKFDGRQGQGLTAKDGAARLRVKVQFAHNDFRLAGSLLPARDLGTPNRGPEAGQQRGAL
jgi:hypothetical protein